SHPPQHPLTPSRPSAVVRRLPQSLHPVVAADPRLPSSHASSPLAARAALVLLALIASSSARAGSWPELASPPFTLDTSLPRLDADADGIPDSWETTYGLNPGSAADASANPDGDSLTNLQEYNGGWNPRLFEPTTLPSAISAPFSVDARSLRVDTDSDGLPDTWEIAVGLSPSSATGSNAPSADPDGDGFTNLQEYNAGTLPLVPDRPALSQGVSALFTVDLGAYFAGFSTDTDSDGMPDWWEARYGLNRLVNDATGNLDGDELNNLAEYRAGRIPNRDDQSGEAFLQSATFALDTIGLAPDTDSDRLPDWWELLYGLNPLVANASADPDGDGWTNLEEYNAGTNPVVNDRPGPSALATLAFLLNTGAYPLGFSADTDGDRMPDWWEDKYGLNRLLATDAAVDPDGDYLTNLEEYRAGTHPRVYDFVFVANATGGIFTLDTGGRYTDSDFDGIPNWWERQFTGSDRAMSATADNDGDGHSNRDEYIANLDPNSSSARFEVRQLTMENGPSGPQLVVRWLGQPKRRYRVFITENLAAWPATPSLEITGAGADIQHIEPLRGRARLFCRVAVEVIEP
ncbi:MAG: hypothetical protein RLZZ50_221, partial [Verrucomicrobiota bacterium]